MVDGNLSADLEGITEEEIGQIRASDGGEFPGGILEGGIRRA